jgi:hypothetical protein
MHRSVPGFLASYRTFLPHQASFRSHSLQLRLDLARLLQAVLHDDQDFQCVGLSPVPAIDAGFSDPLVVLAPDPILQHPLPTSHQSVALQLLMHGLTPQNHGVLVVGNSPSFG